ncbi:MAG TPA: exodeoxyribonuclease V subunit gamma [Microthrixaceae bacterium]|nr:exodeoxyribonuclease V subunit gamma [Microthrixaceae bacterium]
MLQVHISDHVAPLVEVLAEQLAAPLEDPFASEWVAVPSIGMRRWLTQQLSRRLGTHIGADGIAANVSMPFPDELRRAVLAADRVPAPSGSGMSAGEPLAMGMVPEIDPWEPERLVWAVLDALTDPSLGGNPLLAPLADPPLGSSIVGRAQAIADLFDRYCRHRPDMVRSWVDGRPVDGLGHPVPSGLRWQPELFRMVRDRVGLPSPPERLEKALRRLAAGELDPALPPRLALFGLSTLSSDLAQLIVAASAHFDVTLLFLSASPVAAAAVSAAVSADVTRSAPTAPIARRDDTSAELVHHPLLRSWGAAGRDAVITLASAGIDLAGAPVVGAVDPAAADPAAADHAPHLLGRLRADLAADRAPEPTFRRETGDRSVQVHACSGPTRQVEVLRDAILHLLADDPSLTESDIVVLCPRIEQFAPVIEAVFGPSADTVDTVDTADGAGRPPLLRYRITDRRVRADVPLLGALAAVLDLLPGRFSASAVADVLALAPISSRFGLGADDLDRLGDWVARTNIRWGIDGPHRRRWHLPADHRANTWAAGLDQLLMGTAVHGDDLTLTVGAVAPLAVGDSSTRAAARVAEAVRTLADRRDHLVGLTAPVAQWCEVLADLVDRTCSLPWSESWQRRRLDRVLRDLRDRSVGADGRPSELPLSLADVRRLLGGLLEGEPARAAFGTGAITCCSLSPLRAVPARVVCLLGLDQDALPRGLAAGDDLMALAPRVGDRDPRSETRQLLLDAVMSAQDALVIIYDAVDVRTNLPVPAAVVLDELHDVLADSCEADADDVRSVLRVDHPRHGFDARNFRAVGLGEPAGPAAGRPWGFDPHGLAGARSHRDRPRSPTVELLVPEPLDDLPADDVLTVDRLRQAAVHPVREILTQRLGLQFPRAADDVVDQLPTDLDALARHRLGTDLLAARAQGWDTDRWLRAMAARGALPPDLLVADRLAEVTRIVGQIAGSAVELGVGLDPSERHPIDLDVAGRRLVGVVERCASGDRPGPVTLTYSKAKAAQRIRAAVDLLVLVASDPEPDWRAVVVSQPTKKTGPGDELLLVPRGETSEERRRLALDALAGLVAWRDSALRQPLPIATETSRWLALQQMRKAADAWNDTQTRTGVIPRESSDSHIRAAFGELPFDALIDLEIDGRTAIGHAEALWELLDAAVDEEDRS